MKKSILVATAICAFMTANADYYVVGTVNGVENWDGAEDAKFEEKGNGIYEWRGTELGTGFKINAGNGDWETVNIGSNGSPIENGVPYEYETGVYSRNIDIVVGVVVHNPVLILNIYEETLTLTGDFGGELGGDFDWFVAGINGAWVTNPKEPIGYIMQKTDRKGVFTCEINVTQSEGEFKICTTDWTEEWGTKDPYYVEITNDNLTVELEQIFEVKKGNVPYSLTPGNYRFTWNYNTKIITVAACPDYYVVGANVNGNEDWLGTDRGKFEKKGNGIYEWRGTELGTSFKINAGNGDWETVNIGSNGSPIEKGVPYEYETGSSTLNIELHSGSIVINPVILLNVNDCTLTLTGDFGGEFNWFVAGINDVWVTNPNNSGYLLEQTDEEGVFACEINVVQAEGEFKISKTNWTERWGTNNPDVIELTNENLEVELEELYGEEGNLSYVLTPGNYKFTWDYNTKTLVVTDSSSVISIEEGESEAVYYTLQGVRVANPVKGVYIKVAGNKTDKIVR